MDKTMKRQIGFKKPPQTKEIKAPVKPKLNGKLVVAPKTLSKTTGKATAQDIYKFLREHPLIKIGGLCKVIGSDKSNFYTSMKNGHNLPQEKIDKIVEILKNYGWSG